MSRLGGFVGTRNTPAGEVGRADVQDLALLHQQLEGLPDFVQRHAAVDVMHLIQIDVVRVQPAQAGIAGRADVQSWPCPGQWG